MVSAGAACSSGKVKASRVLTAMGQDELAGCAIRVSGGWNTKDSDWDGFVEAWTLAHERHAARRRAPAAAGV
jgi:cysteine desulfurase